MELRIYSFGDSGKLKRCGASRLAYGRYTEARYTAGTFEISMPVYAAYASELQIDRLVLLDRQYWGVITGREIDNGSNGVITASGAQLTDWLARRVILPDIAMAENAPMGYDSITGTTETIMKHYVEAHAVDPRNHARKIPGLIIAEDKGRGVADDAYMARYVNLLDTLEAIGRRGKLGFSITGNEKTGRFLFDVSSRTDRSIEQTQNKPLILEISRGNVAQQVFNEDFKQSGNVFYCSRAGSEYEWETLTQTYFMDGEIEPYGISRREQALSISVDASGGGNQYEELEKNARKEMEAYKAAQSATCTMSRNMTYGKDYRLGDYATVIDRRAGITANMEIEEVETVTTEMTVDRMVTFGNAQLSKMDKIRRDMKVRL